MANLAGKRPVTPRVRSIGPGEIRAAVGGGRHPRKLHDVLNVIFVHAKIDHRGPAVEQNLGCHLERCLALGLGQFGERFSGVLGVWGMSGDANAAPLVSPPERVVQRRIEPGLLGGILQSLQEFCRAPLAGPRGHDGRLQRGARGDVGVLIGGDSLPAGTGLFDQFRRLTDQPPGFLPGRLEVRDMHGSTRIAANFECFIDRLEQLHSLAPNVADVQPPVPPDGAGDGGQFCSVGVGTGNIDQAARDAPGPFAHRLFRERLHLGQFVGGGRSLRQPHHPFAKTPLGQQVCHVSSAVLALDLVVVISGQHGARPAVAGDDGGTALH